jgi:HSP20 family molecular chaperone IbpA
MPPVDISEDHKEYTLKAELPGMTKEDVKVTAGAPPYRPSLRIVAQSLEICERFGITTYVDESLSKQDYIVFEAGTHTDAIKLSYADYERIARPNAEDLAIGPRAT